MTQLTYGEPSLKLLKQNLGLILGSAAYATHRAILETLHERGTVTSAQLNASNLDRSKVAVALAELRRAHLIDLIMGDGPLPDWPIRLTKAAAERMGRRLERAK